MRDVTLCFLIKKESDKISEVCLAMKKRGFGEGRWNGVGGKLKEGETIEEALHRETNEEIGIIINQSQKVAELEFMFAEKPEWNQLVHTYFCDDWQGEPQESEEMNPAWFKPDGLPFDSMWPDDPFWLPHVLNNKLVKAHFTFGPNDVVLKKRVKFIDNFEK